MASQKSLILSFMATISLLAAALNTCTVVINAANLKSEEYEHDRVVNLPGQPINPRISQFSGYISVNEAHGRALFYWFFEAQSTPADKPLLLWLNGGPGCSSIGYGAAVELGPLRVVRSGDFLEYNKHSWNKEANLLFVESPVGVGFSYTNTSSDFDDVNDEFVAEDTYDFLVNWLERFPHFKNHNLFISGESYAGHYVPQLSELVYDRNKNAEKYPYINLKGFIVGNPETNDYYDYKGLLEYAWSHSVVSDQEYEAANRSCDFRQDNWSIECAKAMTTVFNSYKKIDIYNIYAPSCLTNKSAPSSPTKALSSYYGLMRRMKVVPGGYDPCYSNYAEEYFNRADVQKALHVLKRSDRKGNWKVCNDSLFERYNYTVFSVLPIYRKLIEGGGLRIWVYSGDADGRVPVIGSRYCMEALELPVKNLWTPWFYNHQVAGRVIEYEEGMTFVTVRGAGHLVPLNKPSEALALITAYLHGRSLLTTHR